ncbi:hypothetical protein EMIHUDRAFT_234022 [Emiliania huxleyi CCMP1516]|uniref:Uncharacterized protein n=2 Tax=Emiliania huxleyi TaxID=2903 RepID=A0A0D3K022_EMIH1|nr:hypothetical protein EMIHUDRAFT_234022 [Emiliania huxleyi CCMP1516]EOD29107.1 hypothetical protein EMIHUDRAFT_234022 [Emiliania huxleyi CCMP1516]|eukprot:XP_005781536.1 hypothetical protein EMIHUDRAFT_234022 [Emiliania huxleyi CCMP1516]
MLMKASAVDSGTPAGKRKRQPIDVEVCWGSILSGGASVCEVVPPKGGAFREKFCARCRQRGVLVPVTRVRVPVGTAELSNQRTAGVWNSPSRAVPWPDYRIINQTADCTGPILVILRNECSVRLPNLAPLPDLPAITSLPWPPPGFIAFRVSRTLVPMTPLPWSFVVEAERVAAAATGAGTQQYGSGTGPPASSPPDDGFAHLPSTFPSQAPSRLPMAPYPPIAVTIAPSLLPASAAAAAPAAEPAAEPAAAQPSPLAAGLAAHEVEDLDERLADLLDRESAENIAAFLGLAPSAPPSPSAGPLPSFGATWLALLGEATHTPEEPPPPNASQLLVPMPRPVVSLGLPITALLPVEALPPFVDLLRSNALRGAFFVFAALVGASPLSFREGTAALLAVVAAWLVQACVLYARLGRADAVVVALLFPMMAAAGSLAARAICYPPGKAGSSGRPQVG